MAGAPAIILSQADWDAIEREACERSLAEFTRRAWHVIEPGDPLIWNWHLDVLSVYIQFFYAQIIKKLILNIPPGAMKSVLFSVMGPAWAWTIYPHYRIINLTNESGLATRDSMRMKDVITSEWYQRLWGDRVILEDGKNEKTLYENTQKGFRQGLGITGNLSGKRGNFLLIDDPIDTKKAFSDVENATVNTTYDQACSSRLNNLARDCIGLIAQRSREDDLTGHMISKKKTKWVHVRIAMEYEGQPGYDPVKDLGKEYAYLKDPRTKVGELMFPARFPRDVVESLKEDLGEFGCTPKESPILMADLSMKPISEICVGDKIIGFERRIRPDNKQSKMKLAHAEVLAVHKYPKAKIVKMTLDSGESIRCTRDHKWYLSRSNTKDGRKIYGQVILGRTKLARVCNVELPELNAAEERMAGWLAGFYDGEGTVSLCKKYSDGNYRDSAVIQFYQGAEKNLPICEKLESILNHFKFDYSINERQGKKRDGTNAQLQRYYVLRGNDLPMYQKFLHIAQPVKWKERIVNGCLGANFVKGREKVIKIEDDGEEDVYALTTTTGNYVVWGIASSNSAAQLQQRPNPMGGGIIKKSYWTPWPKDKPLPQCYTIFISLDTAFTDKDYKEAAYSALTAWGVFDDEQAVRPAMILLGKWWERVAYPDLKKKVKEKFKDFNCDIVLIENKASGISLYQDIRRMRGITARRFNPGKLDKIARAYRATPLMEAGLVYYPEGRQWAIDVIELAAKFPTGAPPCKDLTDTITQAIIWVRERGWAKPEEDDYHAEPQHEQSEEEMEDNPKGRGAAYG